MTTKEDLRETDKAKRRVAIAKDVLSVLAGETAIRLNVEPGHWLEVSYGRVLSADERAKQVRDSPIKSCAACAAGALFLGYLRKENHVTVEELLDMTSGDLALGHLGFGMGDFERFWSKLRELFEEDQLQRIEKAFELGIGAFKALDTNDKAAIIWAHEQGGPDARLRAIMENIVANNGEFVVPSSYWIRVDASFARYDYQDDPEEHPEWARGGDMAERHNEYPETQCPLNDDEDDGDDDEEEAE